MIYSCPSSGSLGALTLCQPAAGWGERGTSRFDFLMDPAGPAVTLMKAVSSWVFRVIYTGMLLTWRNGFCNAYGTFFLKAINMVTNGCYKLDGLSQIGLFFYAGM